MSHAEAVSPSIDLRSDTVTQPTAAMRAAMAQAPVGDDCYGDDPSVSALEQAVAQRLGKDDAVFLPTGTMSNQLAVRLHARPGQTIACHDTAHVRIHEDASAAALGGVQLMPLGGRTGYTASDLEALVHEESCGWPPVSAAWLENTLGDPGGVLWVQDELAEVARWAHDHGRTVHLDGARLWNAHVASGRDLAELAAPADTVSVSMSKGLGAPAGSLLAGSRAWVDRARALRHGMGGSMRQSGILAAAGLHALSHHVERLAEDHARARRLAAAIADLPGLRVNTPQTNMVIAAVEGHPAETLCGPLRAAGVLCHPNRYREVRWVLHLGIDDAALDRTIATIREVAPTVLGA